MTNGINARTEEKTNRPVAEAAERADKHAGRVQKLVEEARSLRGDGKEEEAAKLEALAEEEVWAAREAAIEADEFSQSCLDDADAAWGVAHAWRAASYAWEALHTGKTEA